jgi:arsenite-transporting ATPase
VLAGKGAGLDDAGRALLEEDLRSPCTEEIAVFGSLLACPPRGRQEDRGHGHRPDRRTLLLLDTTGAYDRDVRATCRATDGAW